MIVERVEESLKRQIKQYPVRSIRASSIGHPCTRYLVYEQTKWQEKELHGIALQNIFNLGNDIEERVLKDLREAGIAVAEQQRAFEWKEHNITGHIDGMALIDGEMYPIEVKSASPYVFDKINSVEDMKKSKYAYMRAYPAQMTLYLLMGNKELGFFLFKNKVNGALKEIPVHLDYEFGESLLRKAEDINGHVKDGTLPDQISEEGICSDCAYQHICRPMQIGKEIEMVDSTELVELIERSQELKPVAAEYAEIDKRINQIVNGKDKLLVGEWFVSGSWRKRVSYDVPEDIKKPYAKETQYWVKKIQHI